LTKSTDILHILRPRLVAVKMRLARQRTPSPYRLAGSLTTLGTSVSPPLPAAAVRAGLSLQSSLDLLHHVPRLFPHFFAIETQHRQERQHPIYAQGDRTRAKVWGLEPE
jgi:hypothetical protein